MIRASFCAFLVILISSLLFAQTGKITTPMKMRATRISEGDLKINENLFSRGGDQLSAGMYKVAVTIDTRGSAEFVLTPYNQPKEVTEAPLSKHASNVTKINSISFAVPANIKKNSLVRGLATNIEGEFRLETLTPSEAILSFYSKNFEASAILGRPLDSKLVDLLPTFVTLEKPNECGLNCIEGNVKVIVRNDGNSDAKGKWNVVLNEPAFYVGSVSDLAGGQEVTVVSSTKLRLPCCNAVSLDAEVRPDFYNKDGVDSNDSNNAKKFTVRLTAENPR